MLNKSLQKFWSKVKKGSENDCWEWQGLKHPFGYGRLNFNKKPVLAHRLSFELANGPINNSKLCVCHHCDNPSCVNPNHLFLGDRKTNNSDRQNKGRTFKGSQVTTSKFTEQQIKDIRSSDLTINQLAKKYQVTYQHMWLIVRNKSWRHIN